MDSKQKVRASVAAGLAGIALVAGGASIASGQTDTQAAPTRPPSGTTGPDRSAQPRGDRDHDGRPCPKEQGGAGASPTAPTAGTPAV